jgi:hypothetical protein
MMFREITYLWPSPAALAEDLGVSIHAVRKYRMVGHIDARHWPRLLDAAAKRGIPLTADDLIAAVRASRARPYRVKINNDPNSLA